MQKIVLETDVRILADGGRRQTKALSDDVVDHSYRFGFSTNHQAFVLGSSTSGFMSGFAWRTIPCPLENVADFLNLCTDPTVQEQILTIRPEPSAPYSRVMPHGVIRLTRYGHVPFNERAIVTPTALFVEIKPRSGDMVSFTLNQVLFLDMIERDMKRESRRLRQLLHPARISA